MTFFGSGQSGGRQTPDGGRALKWPGSVTIKVCLVAYASWACGGMGIISYFLKAMSAGQGTTRSK